VLTVKKGQGRRLAVSGRQTLDSYGITSATFDNQTLVRLTDYKSAEFYVPTCAVGSLKQEKTKHRCLNVQIFLTPGQLLAWRR
jgi:hypothetical protein